MEPTEDTPQLAQGAVLVESEEMPEGTPIVQGINFEEHVTIDQVLGQYLTSGFQATNFGLAIEEVNKMIRWRLSDVPFDPEEEDEEWEDPELRARTKCTIFLSYTSNLISSGIRETILFLVKHKMVDCVVTTAGGIEEDFIKCLAPTYLGSFGLKGKDLREKGVNRIGNLLVPNNNYCLFEDWFSPILKAMTREQVEDGKIWSPSAMIDRMGQEINDERSVYYWCHRNQIPVFCPAITDGSIGDMVYFHTYKHPEFIIDIARDIRGINDIALKAKASGMIILGGGLVKHHVCNANLMRNGANFSVFINTGQEFDGSDSGARPDEAVSWGKIRIDATPVKIYADATLVFPLLVSQTFAKYGERLNHEEHEEEATA